MRIRVHLRMNVRACVHICRRTSTHLCMCVCARVALWYVCLSVYTCTTCNKCVSARFSRCVSRVARLQYDGVSLFIIFNRSYGSARVRTKRDLANRSMRLAFNVSFFLSCFLSICFVSFFSFCFSCWCVMVNLSFLSDYVFLLIIIISCGIITW